MSLFLKQGSPSAGMAFSVCGPSDVNSAAPAVTAPAVDGRGVHIPSLFCGPLRSHDSGVYIPYHCLTGTGIACDCIRSDFSDDFCSEFVSQALDAPDCLAAGSSHALTYGRYSCHAITRFSRGAGL